MVEFNVSNLIKILQERLGVNQEIAGRYILEPFGLREDVRVDISSKMISNLVNRKTDVHSAIKSVALKKGATDDLKPNVQGKIIEVYNEIVISSLCDVIFRHIEKDLTSPQIVLRRLDKMLTDGCHLDFLVTAFIYAIGKPNVVENFSVGEDDFYYLEEASFKCQLCGKKLWESHRDKIIKKYQIVDIASDRLKESGNADYLNWYIGTENKKQIKKRIALCADCGELYVNNPCIEDFKLLIDRKEKLEQYYRTQKTISSQKIEEKIIDVITAVASIDINVGISPFTEVVTVKEKIRCENAVLCKAITDDVVDYYTFIEKQFSSMEDMGHNSFDLIRSQVAVVYETLENEGYSQGTIFSMISDWLLEINGLDISYRDAANVVTSFFVQNCTVFKKI